MTTSRPTAAIVAAGLIGGYVLAEVTHVRAVGGLALSVAGATAGREWSKDSPIKATALGSLYTSAFALSHPLAKRIGTWPAILTVTAVAAAAAWAFHDRDA